MSFRIATIAGIPIRIHFTFLLVFLWLFMAAEEGGLAKSAAMILGVFVCVVLHELGHALVAKRFGVRTRDITLYPIGGVAMFIDRPKPKQEFWISLAGPMVNVVIALILWPVVMASDGHLPSVSAPLWNLSIQSGLFIANVILPVFNMIPAFPMDGGRVLRAALGMIMPEWKATSIAAKIGQTLAMIGFVVGVITGWLGVVLIAIFVFLGAGQELAASYSHSLLEGKKVSDAMKTSFATVAHNDTLEEVSKLLLKGTQHDFPVVFGTEPLGVLTRADIVRGMASGAANAYVAGFMRRDYAQMSPSDPLEEALEKFSQTQNTPILVIRDGQIVGMLTSETLSEFLLFEQARRQ